MPAAPLDAARVRACPVFLVDVPGAITGLSTVGAARVVGARIGLGVAVPAGDATRGSGAADEIVGRRAETSRTAIGVDAATAGDAQVGAATVAPKRSARAHRPRDAIIVGEALVVAAGAGVRTLHAATVLAGCTIGDAAA